MTALLPRRSRRRAFTLIEVLGALVLAAIILPVAMRGITLAQTAGAEARHQMEAGSLAESKLADLVATGDWQGPELSGDFGQAWLSYRWSAEVTDWEQDSLRQLTVRVEWTSRGVPRSVALTTLVYAGSE